MSIDPVRVGRRITVLRELAGLSLSGVAEKAGIAKSYLHKLEKGEVPNPGLRTLDAIARALGVTLADLLEVEQPTPRKTRKTEETAGEPKLAGELSEFVREWEREHDRRMPADIVKSLATMQFRGKRPQTKDDWKYIYEFLSRTIEG